MRKSRKNSDIIAFIEEFAELYPETIAQEIVSKFHVSRTTANNYLRHMVDRGFLQSSGSTKARVYSLNLLVNETFVIPLSHGMGEDAVWRHRVFPLLQNIPKNIVEICQYCFTEMLNNAIDHSASPDAVIEIQLDRHQIRMSILDRGIGIFEKITRDFHLDDPRTALLELSKGKLTSDSANHSGQGIFFTSRMLDEFQIISGKLFYSRFRKEDNEWLIERRDETHYLKGTYVRMFLRLDTDRTMSGVFEMYQGAELSFRKTHVPIKLSLYPGEQLVSRSQAKRVLARFENFTEVMLDFSDVEQIGQSFADEIFRVFANAHPEIDIFAINTSESINKVIEFVRQFNADQKSLP